MGRRRHYAPLRVYLNNRLLGHLLKEPSGAILFRYNDAWLNWEHAFPVSLSLPLQEDDYRGAPVAAVFENLLPDSDILRRRVAEKVGARYRGRLRLLSVIGRDCVGALQFVTEDTDENTDTTLIEGEPINEAQIEHLLGSLAQAPLGLNRDEDFRISVAGAQEKTALLWHEGRWLKPRGTTPTSHILKSQIGRLPNGIDFSNSVENEFYCLKLVEAFGLDVNQTAITNFGDTKALVIERFDRHWTRDARLRGRSPTRRLLPSPLHSSNPKVPSRPRAWNGRCSESPQRQRQSVRRPENLPQSPDPLLAHRSNRRAREEFQHLPKTGRNLLAHAALRYSDRPAKLSGTPDRA